MSLLSVIKRSGEGTWRSYFEPILFISNAPTATPEWQIFIRRAVRAYGALMAILIFVDFLQQTTPHVHEVWRILSRIAVLVARVIIFIAVATIWLAILMLLFRITRNLMSGARWRQKS